MKKSIPYPMLILHNVMQDDTLPVSSTYILQFYQDWCRIHSSELKERSMYSYTVENLQTEDGHPHKVTTIYPLGIGVHVQIGCLLVKVVEILMYNDEAVIVVESL